MVERVAKALREIAKQFDAPVRLYVEPEAFRRFEKENPDADPDYNVDWALESRKIFARAANAAMREHLEDGEQTVAMVNAVNMEPSAERLRYFREMIDAALK